MTFTPTSEQVAIIEAATKTKDNLIVEALAGAAKTSTLELVCRAVTGIPIYALAFNKKIATEMQQRLPSHVIAMTMNSLGHRVWGQFTSKRLVIETNKVADSVKSVIDGLPADTKTLAYETMGDTIKLISAAKTSGYIPKGRFSNITPLIDEDSFLASLDEDPHDFQVDILRQVVARGISQSFDGIIDFNDQLYMPTLFGGVFPKPPLVIVDEAQDLSPLNHEMLRKLVTKRLIAVGDPYQSIYGFRGAVTDGMDALREEFSMRQLSLSVSFRCPRAVVEVARSRAPNMKYPDWAAEGHVERLERWFAGDIPDGSAIICRNNAPLFKCAFHLIKAGRGVTLVGADIGPALVKILKKFGEPAMPAGEVHLAIDKWRDAALRKSRRKASVEDRAECLRIFAAQGPNLGSAIAYAEHIFAARGPIQLMTGHKSKGLEFDNVYFLDDWLIPAPWADTQEALQQEANLRYVITTRAKACLYYVSLETLAVKDTSGQPR